MLLGLRITRALLITSLELRCNSQLVASQIWGEYEAKNDIRAQFKRLEAVHVPKVENRMANALANLASNAPYPCHAKLNVLAHSLIFEKGILLEDTRTFDSWITPLTIYLKEGVLPSDKKSTVKIKARAARYWHSLP